MQTSRRLAGFTLIELLIVVAIIAILALIAVPNFLEAQTRSKVVRVKTDFRNLLVATESYYVDNNSFPPDNGGPLTGSSWYNDYLPLIRLTTPIAYITTVPTNPFFDIRQSQSGGTAGVTGRGNYAYWGGDRHPNIREDGYRLFWHIISCGPDARSELGDRSGEPSIQARYVLTRRPEFINGLYDPTNGTVSRGDLDVNSYSGMAN